MVLGNEELLKGILLLLLNERNEGGGRGRGLFEEN
jgi:hypothetical protein